MNDVPILNKNESFILKLIRDRKKINKSTIAYIANISVPTAMKITNNLVSRGMVRYCGRSESRGGRTSELYEFSGSSFYSIGVDISPTKIKVILMDLDGCIIFKQDKSFDNNNTPYQLVEDITSLIKNILENVSINILSIIGIGVGMPGILNVKNGDVLFSPNFHWENIKLLSLLKNSIKKSVDIDFDLYLENTNRVSALAEKYFGKCRKVDSFIAINLGYGIGSAIYNDNDLYRGSSETSGEFGHITVEKDGILCTCGNNGCLEALASGRAIALQAKNLIASGVKTEILNLVDGNIDKIYAKTVFEAAKINDNAALDLLQKASEYIGIGIATYINLFDPKKIVLMGGMSNETIFIDRIKDAVAARQMRFAGREVTISVSDLGEYSTSIGAASINLMNFLKFGLAKPIN